MRSRMIHTNERMVAFFPFPKTTKSSESMFCISSRIFCAVWKVRCWKSLQPLLCKLIPCWCTTDLCSKTIFKPQHFEKYHATSTVHLIYQTTGSFVVVGARAYHSVQNVWYNIASATNIANMSWIFDGSAFVKHMHHVQHNESVPILYDKNDLEGGYIISRWGEDAASD